MKLPSLPKPQAPRSTRLNEFTSAEHREVALRARGLVPARYRDKTGYTLPLSEQETQMDQRFSVLMEEPSTEGSEGETEAKRIREAWLQRREKGGGEGERERERGMGREGQGESDDEGEGDDCAGLSCEHRRWLDWKKDKFVSC